MLPVPSSYDALLSGSCASSSKQVMLTRPFCQPLADSLPCSRQVAHDGADWKVKNVRDLSILEFADGMQE
jgi:hypothetical protein